MSDNTDLLHKEVEALGLTSHLAEAVVHALIDTGRVTELVCQDENCLHPGVRFENSGRRNLLGLSIDHKKMQSEGGSHRLENLRIVHYACNCGWTKNQERPLHGAMVEVSRLLKATRHLQTMSYGKDPAELEGDELKDYVRTNLLAAQVELAELAQELRWKPWKNIGESIVPTGEDERHDVIMEAVDVVFFYFNIMVALGITSSELVRGYVEKYEINELRMLIAAGNKLAKDQLPPPLPTQCSECDGEFVGTRGLSAHVAKTHAKER